MPRFSITVDESLNEWLDEQHGEGEPHDSKSGAAAHYLEIAREVAESGHSVGELLEAVERVDDLEEELERARAERDDLQRQLANANQRIDTTNELVRAVEEQRSLEARRAQAGVTQRAKWWLFGMPDGQEESGGT